MGFLNFVFRGNGSLIYQFTQRDVLARYRGSFLGVSWSVLNPVLMLMLYAYAFAGILKTKWPGADAAGGVGYAFNLFAGLIIFNFFAEVASRAPSLVIQNANLVKKVVFPLHVFSWVAVFSAMFQLFLAFLILLGALIFIEGGIPVTAIAFSVIVLVFVPFLLGVCWFLSSIGVYVRDLSQVMTFVLNLELFLSPIFYPASALPDVLKPFLYLNPLSIIIEQTRNVLIVGVWPDWWSLFAYMIASCGFAFIGYAWFQHVRKGFADVL